jgi:serpin B
MLAALSLAASSCSEEPAGTETGLESSIFITLGSRRITIAQGQSGTVDFVIGRQGDFSVVTVTVEGHLDGVTVPALSVPTDQIGGTLTLNVAANAPTLPPRLLTVRATGPGVTAVTVPLELIIQGVQVPARPTITELPRALSATEREVLARSNAFAFSLAKKLLPPAPDSNLFYSPLSASMLLGMILNGADGNTYTQMRGVLGFDGLTQEQINQGYADLIGLLTSLDSTVTMELGNSIWAAQGFPVLPDFMQRVQSSFGAEAANVNFGDPGTLPRINRWASDATHGRIETIFDRLPPNVVMVLLNAIYFKGSWTQQFDKARTEPAPFRRPDGSTVTADLMYLDTYNPGFPMTSVLGLNDVTLVDLPYGGAAFSMTLALPAAGRSVSALVESLTVEQWNAWMAELGARKRGMIVRLPRFELGWEKALNDPLEALGMTDAFNGGAADFRRLTPEGGVWLSLVKQKSFVKVDEEGTEAAAVTGGVVAVTMPPEIRFDRPFLFVIRERLTGTILFMGVIHDPTA